jgi:heavy metal efflux system protein
MLQGIIEFSLRNRWLVVGTALLLAGAGVVAMFRLDIDAFPDTTPVQVQINTVAPSFGPLRVEESITAPVEQELSNLPRVKLVRSISKFGLSQVVATFEDGTDIYFARQLVSERLAKVQLPLGIERPTLGPVSTGLGEVFHYVVTGNTDDPTELRTVHDWLIRPQMRKVPGTAEINSWGGFERQFQIHLAPASLQKYGLGFADVSEAVKRNNRNAGGGSVHENGRMLLVEALGRAHDVDEIGSVVVASRDGVPVRVRDLGEVRIGHEVRRGAVTFDGKGEVVLGLGFMTMGENSHEVTQALKKQLDEVKKGLPRNIQVIPVYDRTTLVNHVIGTVKDNLLEGGLLVVSVLFAFLGNLRAALIVALAIPLSMLFAFSGMLQVGIAASLLSLGAIDFGLVVDSSVVLMENCVRHVAHGDLTSKTKEELVRDAALEVRRPTLFGELIILIVYLPILALEGIEGKLFRPMALTVIFALLGSMVLSMTLMPALANLLLPRRIRDREPILMRLAHAIHTPILKLCIRFKGAVIGFALCVLLFAFGFVLPNLGSEFVPRLSEGAIALNVIRLPGTDLEESVRANTRLEKLLLREFPDEVEHVWSRVGSAEVATDPMGVELTDLFITLKPREKWKRAATQEELTTLIEREFRKIPGHKFSFSQPIEMRINEMISGVRSDVGIKIFGDDIEVLKQKASQVAEAIKGIYGVADLSVEPITGQPYLQIALKQDSLARYGVAVESVMELVESLGSNVQGEILQDQMRFPLVIRLPDSQRTPEAIERMLVTKPTGETIPLGRLAKVEVVEGPSTITREWGQRRAVVTCNVRGRDLGSFVEEARREVRDRVSLPSARYRVEFGGQYENLQRARLRLMIVVPLAFALIFALLYATYQSVIDSVRVFTGVPFAWVGGLVALWARDMPFSISAAVGFIALSGVAVLDDMILVSYVRKLRGEGKSLDEAVTLAATIRLRPVLMTTLVAALGFIPMAFSTGVGAEVQRPLATVVIGGVIGGTVMSLLVLRVLYLVFNRTHEGNKSPRPQGEMT